ncbi:MAG TPA: serine hydrolase domain-containing protein [Kofleriaceae bacterium]|nr:serine hydrolase domain-containing protein [Kofleriaceae bacterium]
MERIRALLDEALAANLGSAAAVSVGDSGREVFRYLAGTTRRVPDAGPAISENTPFDLASVTKPMSTVAIAMVLVAEGRLDLDAPVRHYLPAAQTTASVRQLLGHTAGCASHVEFFRRLRAERPANPRSRLIDLACAEPCDPPGTTAIYSDLGFIQLGAVVEAAAAMPLEQAFTEYVAAPLGLTAARFAPAPIVDAVATELDDRGLVCGLVHDENCYFGGRIAGHAGLFSPVGDVVTFAQAMVDTAAGTPRGRFTTDVVTRFFTDAPTPGSTWRLGWDSPSHTPGISQAGDRWPRTGAVGHTGFTGTSVWLDLAHRRWVVLLTNRVHPTRHGTTADAIKALRRAVHDTAMDALPT